jgi:hypothetical protein
MRGNFESTSDEDKGEEEKNMGGMFLDDDKEDKGKGEKNMGGMFLDDEEMGKEVNEEEAGIDEAVAEALSKVPSDSPDTSLDVATKTEGGGNANIIVNSPKDLWGLGSIKLLGRVEGGEEVVAFIGQCAKIWDTLRVEYGDQLVGHATQSQLGKIQALCWETDTNLEDKGVVAATLTVFEAGKLIEELSSKASNMSGGQQPGRAQLPPRGQQTGRSSPQNPVQSSGRGRGGGSTRGQQGGPTLKQVAYLALLRGDIDNSLFSRISNGESGIQDLPSAYGQIANTWTGQQVSDQIQQEKGS